MSENMFQKMQGKVALVTGATSGIGRETALLFAKNKAKVILAARNTKEGQKIQNEIVKTGGEALFVSTDVADYASVKTLMEKAKQQFGQIDYAVNNAGIEGRDGILSEMEEKDYDEILNINLKGVWLCLKFQLQAMMSTGGSIVNVSSYLTKMGRVGTSLYTASKAGVEALTKVAAVEYGNFKIRINAVGPGPVDTPMIRRIYSKEELKKLAEKNPLKRIAYAEDVAYTILWLCSPMADHISGEVVYIDGGSSLAT